MATEVVRVVLDLDPTVAAMIKWDASHKVHCRCNHACIPVRKLLLAGKWELITVEETDAED